MNLTNKKILFIAPDFYNYHLDIINYIESKNGYVSFVNEELYSPYYRIISRLNKKYAGILKIRYREKIISKISQDEFDLVLVIRGGILNEYMMCKLKEKLPKAKYIMYQWDSLKQNNFKSIIKYFNVVNTFDKKDAEELGIGYLPLYFSENYKSKYNKNNLKNDIIFIGAYHSDRLEVIKQIENISIKNNLNFIHHLFITKMGLLRNILIGKIKISDLKYLKTYSLKQEEIINLYNESLAVLDIELTIQNGLTMRTFETLAAGLKLITTNSFVTQELIYNSNNIFVINRKNIKLDSKFFKSEFKINQNIDNYSFENWFAKLFEKGEK